MNDSADLLREVNTRDLLVLKMILQSQSLEEKTACFTHLNRTWRVITQGTQQKVYLSGIKTTIRKEKVEIDLLYRLVWLYVLQ